MISLIKSTAFLTSLALNAVAAEHYAGDRYSGSVSAESFDDSWVPHNCPLAKITIQGRDFATKATWNGTHWSRTRFVTVFGKEPRRRDRTTVSGYLTVAFSSDENDEKSLVSVRFEGLLPPTTKEFCIPLAFDDTNGLSDQPPE